MPEHARKVRRLLRSPRPKPLNTLNSGNFTPISNDLQESGEMGVEQVVQLQRMIGNAATIRLLDNRQPGRIQRCTGRPDCQCPQCKAKRAAKALEQNEQSADENVIHRDPDNKKVLTAPELVSSPRLQAIISGDKSKNLHQGQTNEGVKAVQEAFLKLQYPLPKFGADGIYGSETNKAVKAFQDETGESTDGIVGELTLTKLNSALLSPHPPTPGTPGLTADDKEIKGVTGKAATTPDQIFFDKGSAALTDDKTALSTGVSVGKIQEIAKETSAVPKQFTVTGFRSEDEPDALAGQRTGAVAAELTKELNADPASAGFKVDPQPNIAVGPGISNYRSIRKVAITKPGAPSPAPVCEQVPCPANLKDDFLLADQKIDAAIAKVADPTAEPLLTKYFGITPANKADVSAIIIRNLTRLKGQLATHLQKETKAPGAGLQCGTDCFETCTSSAAFVTGTSKAARMVLCPGFFRLSDAGQRAELLIHEGSHGTDWETTTTKGKPTVDGTTDHAYDFTRLNTELEPEFALVNADSYVMFISEALAAPGKFKPGVAVDKYDKDVDATVKKGAQKAIAYLEMYIATATTSVDGAYSGIEDAQKAGKWGDTFERSSFSLLARRFQFTPPPAPPTNDEQIAVAAIFDRFRSMVGLIRGNISIKQDAAATTTWKTGKGVELTLGSDFIAATSDRSRLEVLILSWVKFVPGISSNVQEQYAGVLGDMRRQRSLAEAPVK
jgi:peptidoglycan hydrolase-like protein with peptidoglycan-binding domain